MTQNKGYYAVHHSPISVPTESTYATFYFSY